MCVGVSFSQCVHPRPFEGSTLPEEGEEEEDFFFDFSKGTLYYIPLRIQIDIYKLIYIQIRDL